MKTDGIRRYFQLVEERPELFAPSELIPLCLEEEAMRTFARQSGRAMGVVYDNSPHWWVLADLCLGKGGPYSYGRVVYCDPRSNGCAALIRRSGTGEFGLLTVFRHGCRALSLEIPRGFRDKADRTAQENVRREVAEELGVAPEDCLISPWGPFGPMPACPPVWSRSFWWNWTGMRPSSRSARRASAPSSGTPNRICGRPSGRDRSLMASPCRPMPSIGLGRKMNKTDPLPRILRNRGSVFIPIFYSPGARRPGTPPPLRD